MCFVHVLLVACLLCLMLTLSSFRTFYAISACSTPIFACFVLAKHFLFSFRTCQALSLLILHCFTHILFISSCLIATVLAATCLSSANFARLFAVLRYFWAFWLLNALLYAYATPFSMAITIPRNVLPDSFHDVHRTFLTSNEHLSSPILLHSYAIPDTFSVLPQHRPALLIRF